MKSVNTLDASCFAFSTLHYGFSKSKLRSGFSCRYYSTSNSDSGGQAAVVDNLPLPVLTINNLIDKDCIKSFRELLSNKGGIYSFINIENGNQYALRRKCQRLLFKIKWTFR